MTVKQIRKAAGMTQCTFATKYGIPLQTLKQWESDSKSSAHREPPEYVVEMLRRLVSLDCGINLKVSDRAIERMVAAATDSRYNAAHWMRYLRKEINGGHIRLTPYEIQILLDCDELSMFQKVSLKRAADVDSLTNEYISTLNMKAGTPMVDEIMRGLSYVEK